MNISDAESQVIEVLWQNSPLTARAITRSLTAKTDWSPKTIRTLLNRLEKKGVLACDRKPTPNQYRPLVSREDWLRTATGELVQRHCGGRLTPLVAAFAEQQHLTDQDREELLALLESLE